MSNKCCCINGIKKSLYIIKCIENLIDENKKITIYYSNFKIDKTTINSSKYESFVFVSGEQDNEAMELDIAIQSIHSIAVFPKNNEYQLIMNELNKYYYSPISLNIDDECESCCQKYSVANYMIDKYVQPISDDRMFYIQLDCKPYQIGNNNEKVCVYNLDCDIAWILDYTTKAIYVVNLCNIVAVSD